MRSNEQSLLMAFPEDAVKRHVFVRSLPVRWPRGAVDYAMEGLLEAGLIERVSPGVYVLTDAGRRARAAVRADVPG